MIWSFFSLDVEGKSYSNKSLRVSRTLIKEDERWFFLAFSMIESNSLVIVFWAKHFLNSSQNSRYIFSLLFGTNVFNTSSSFPLRIISSNSFLKVIKEDILAD